MIAGLALTGVLVVCTGLETPTAGIAVTVDAPEAAVVPQLGVPQLDATQLGAPPRARPPDTVDESEAGSARSPGPADQADVRDPVSGPVLPESDPVALSIPRLGIRSTLVELGLDPDGAMEVPRDPARAGWFSRAATPGALGPAVIAGHVTWDGAPGVFHRLGRLRRGDQVAVTRDDGRIAVFAVERVARYPKTRFPTPAVYGAIDHAGLRLVTCGGTYDRSEHRYLDNVVVFAKLETVRDA